MNRTEFETECLAQGYSEIVDRRMEPNTTNPEHSHEFDARLLVLEG
jgi:quercetin dioxygenase-like cupin family protein